VLRAYHDKPSGGHYLDKRTTLKVLGVGYFWLTLQKDVRTYVNQCDQCQRMGKPTNHTQMSLHPQVVIEPFEQWGIDFIGPINPPSKGKKHILVCTYYVTKWVEVIALA